MKYVFIGDIHGRTNWKQIIEKEKDADKFIFFGDYFDPYNWTLTLDEIVTNFNDIVSFKIQNFDKVVLLIGNHDLRSYNNKANECRYIDGTYEQVALILHNGIQEDLFQLCYFIDDKIVCSHAGFSKTWLRDNNLELNESELNNHFKKSMALKLIDNYDFIYGDGLIWPDVSGDNKWQSPLWIRPNSLVNNKAENYIQCVGHTRINKNSNQLYKLDTVKVLLCDCLEHNEYYSYANNEFKFNKL